MPHVTVITALWNGMDWSVLSQMAGEAGSNETLRMIANEALERLNSSFTVTPVI